MSIKKAKRSRTHRPRHANHLGGLSAIYGRERIEDDKQTDVSVTYWLAFDAMAKGHSSERAWAIIGASLNMSLMLAERGLGKDFVPYVVAALDAMAECKQRADSTGAWRFTGPGMCAVRQALEISDEQIKLATQDQVRLALTEADRRARAGHAYTFTYTENREAA